MKVDFELVYEGFGLLLFIVLYLAIGVMTAFVFGAETYSIEWFCIVLVWWFPLAILTLGVFLIVTCIGMLVNYVDQKRAIRDRNKDIERAMRRK